MSSEVYKFLSQMICIVISILIISFAAGLYFLVGRSANKLWERTRDIQNIFFSFIKDLIGGFKELCINFLKRRDFIDDMEKSCNEYRNKRKLKSNV